VDSATTRATSANRGLLKVALAAEGIEDDSESSDDLVLAVDTILGRWAA
jgi:hypothetical protein